MGPVSRLEHSWGSESDVTEKTQVVKHLTRMKGESRCGQVAKSLGLSSDRHRERSQRNKKIKTVVYSREDQKYEVCGLAGWGGREDS